MPRRQREDKQWEEWIRSIESTRDKGLVDANELIQYLYSKDKKVREYIVGVIADLQDQVYAEPLIGCLDDDDSIVRYTAAEALGQLAYAPALHRLAALVTSDSDTLTRVCAAEALGKIGKPTPEVVGALLNSLSSDRSALVRDYALQALHIVNYEYIQYIAKLALKGERNRRVMSSLLTILSEFGDVKSTAKLISLYASTEDEILEPVMQRQLIRIYRMNRTEFESALRYCTTEGKLSENAIMKVRRLADSLRGEHSTH